MKINNYNVTKEDIKNRMLRTAVDFWSVKSIGDLDPFVKLIIEAISTEIFNISNSIKDTEVRLLNKVAQILAPDQLTIPLPAHAILQALPIESSETLTVNNHFYIKINKDGSGVDNHSDDLYFTPVDTVKLQQIEVRYIATGNHIQEQKSGFYKTLIANAPVQLPLNKLWIGLAGIQNTSDSQISFYLQFNVQAHKDLYTQLYLSKWNHHDLPLKYAMGSPFVKMGRNRQDFTNYEERYQVLDMVKNDIKAYYATRFVTVSLQKDEISYNIPADFKIFENNEIEKIAQEKIVWVSIDFPAIYKQEYLSNLFIYTNSFPVVNVRKYHMALQVSQRMNIIPVKTNLKESFITVSKLIDQNNEEYLPISFKQQTSDKKYTYSIRTGGVERFDDRDAKEIIAHLNELLRDDAVAFNHFGQDFTSASLEKIFQQIALLEQKSKEVRFLRESTAYVVVQNLESQKQMYIDYWSTNEVAANNLLPGTKLSQHKNYGLVDDSIRFLTTTFGGRTRLNEYEKLNAYKHSLLSHDRIVSKQDIVNFCFFELGSYINDAEVKTGFKTSNNPKHGYQKTIEILLHKKQELQVTALQLQEILDAFKAKLENRGCFVTDIAIKWL